MAINGQPTLIELRVLAAIVRLGSFRRAANELNLAPSTLSHMMRGLEERLDTRLLHRTTRSVSPTEAGERLVERRLPVLYALDDALTEVGASRSIPTGRLRLTASETVSSLLMEAAIPQFLAVYPQITLDLVANPDFVDIVSAGFDAGFRLGEAVPLDMVAVRFGRPSRMLVVAAPGYMQDRVAPVAPDDLASHICIGSRTPAGRPYKWEFERHGHAIEVEAGGPLILNRTELMVQAALAGLGIAFVPERLVASHLAAGRLIAMLEDWCPAYPGLFLYYPGHRQVPATLRAFIDFLKQTDESRS